MSVAQHRLALPAGYELGRYRFQEVLGSGGFGITYLAEDKTLGRRVAIKELLPNEIATRVDGTTVVAKTESEEESLTWARERFVGEGRALAACDHPNVVNVYEMIEANGTAYMVTKYEDGRSLEQWLRELERPPNESELRSVLLPLLSGLETVHKAGFLHRDIKPENIYITKNGRPVLLDFGSARQAISNRSMAMTSIVTSGYAPFEQYHEDGNQGAWSDIYALAAVIYRAITGKKPPEATRRLKDDPIEKLMTRYAGKYDAEFLRAIDKALSVNEKQRPQTVADWRKMLGTDDRLPLDSEETRLMPRQAKQSDWKALLQSSWTELGNSPRALAIAGGSALILLIGVIWIFARPKPTTSTASSESHHHSITLEPSSSGETTPSPQSSTTPSSAEVTPAPNIAPNVSPGQQPALQFDPRLVGTWEAKTRWRVDPSRVRTGKLELLADGHYTFSGPGNDNGVISTADGHMKQFSNVSNQSFDVAYEFRGDALVTHSDDGTIQWHRLSPGPNETAHTSRPSGRKEPKQRGTDPTHEILKRVLRRWP
jgi:serine/threonine protein kinase